jgi:hypothetical protein
MNQFNINFKNAEGQQVSPVQLHWLHPETGEPLKSAAGVPVITEVLGGTNTLSGDQPLLKFKATATGYADKDFTAGPGTTNVTMQKAGTVGAVVDTAKSKWWVWLLIILLIVAAWFGYKKYIKKG